jgi:serine/threonine-protein phosphatase 6 catalytic subunit
MFDESLVTVWSAPNYCYRCGNMASILTIRGRGNSDGGLCNVEDGSEAVNGGEVGRFFTVFGAAEENERDKGMQTRKLVSVCSAVTFCFSFALRLAPLCSLLTCLPAL